MHDFPEEAAEIWDALRKFTIRVEDITEKGGNESEIPRRFAQLLNWDPEKLTARFILNSEQAAADIPVSADTHKIDFVKGRIAVDFEWNSKDQTFDRDLYAFRSFFDFNRISVGVLVTRGASLKKVLHTFRDSSGESVGKKYGASTTHIQKLLPRLVAGRSGGCPILVFGITPRVIEIERQTFAPAQNTSAVPLAERPDAGPIQSSSDGSAE